MFMRSRSVLLLALLAVIAAACSSQVTPEIQASATIPGVDTPDSDSNSDTEIDGIIDVIDVTGGAVVLGESLVAEDAAETASEASQILDALALPDLAQGAPGAQGDAPSPDSALTVAPAPTPAELDDDLDDGDEVGVESAEHTCVAPVEGELAEPPAWVTDALEAAVAHPDFDGLDVSVSVWIDGWGEVVTRNPDVPLVPASNEKILVAHAANEILDLESTIETVVERVGEDLVFRASGDPTFSTDRARVLVDQVVAQGISSADRLIIDVSDFPQAPAAPGWQSWQIRNFVGPLSGFMLDGNRWTASDEFLQTPAQVNGEWLAERFRISGVEIGSVEVSSAPPGRVVGRVESAPVGNLVRDMMLFSNNQIADMLVLQLGRVDGEGTLENGIAQIEQELAELCVPLAGVMDDGSGLSRANLRSAREFQEILRAIRTSDTAEIFESQLPISRVSGTLSNRFSGDAGRVLAKTGTIFGGRALSGYASTDSGRDAVFSIVINGERDATSSSLAAMDQLVRTILRS